jgi:hypothetical protein
MMIDSSLRTQFWHPAGDGRMSRWDRGSPGVGLPWPPAHTVDGRSLAAACQAATARLAPLRAALESILADGADRVGGEGHVA